MTALVIGASGLVGGALLRVLDGAIGTYLTRPREGLRHLDAADASAVRRAVAEIGPDAVFFPAADPNVDWCEEHPEDSYRRNVTPAIGALRAAREAGSRFAFFSSDYVFDGRAGPYAEDDAPAPLQVYGQHKLEVERAVLAEGGTVVRTTTVYGEETGAPKNFVLRLIARLRAGERVTVPMDQVSTPTWADDLAAAAVAVAGRPGLWHAAGRELMARDELARTVARVFGLDEHLIDPVATASLRQRAQRPLRGGLRIEKLVSATGRTMHRPADALAILRDRIGP